MSKTQASPIPAKPAKSKRAKKTVSQPPPPEPLDDLQAIAWSPDAGQTQAGRQPDDPLYAQLVEVRKVVEQLLQQGQDTKARRSLELVPVRVSDLMQGFQAAVVRANQATRAGQQGAEDIELMAVRDLEVSITAPVIENADAGDPVLMLPNIKSVDSDSPSVTLKFSVVSVPRQQKG